MAEIIKHIDCSIIVLNHNQLCLVVAPETTQLIEKAGLIRILSNPVGLKKTINSKLVLEVSPLD